MPKLKTFKKTLLLGFLLAVFLPLVLIGYFSYSYLSYNIKESVEHRNELLAKNVAIEIASFLNESLVSLRQLALTMDSHEHDRGMINGWLDNIVADSDLLEIVYIIDEKKNIKNIGLIDEYSQLLDNYIGLDLSGLSILRNIEYLQVPSWTQSFLSPISGKKSIALIYPDNNDCYIVGLFNIGYFHSIISEHSRKTGIETIVLDEIGKAVFHPDIRNVEEQRNFANIRPFTESQIGAFGTNKFYLNNIKFTGSTANIAETKWLVMVTQPVSVAHQPIRRMSYLFGLAVLISVVIVVPFALKQSKRLLKPLNDLQDNIKAVSDGDYQEKILAQRYDEFEQVATHFRHMASAIEKREFLLELNEERLVALLDLHNIKQLDENELLGIALEQAVKLTRSQLGYLHFIDNEEKTITRTFWYSNLTEVHKNYDLVSKELEDGLFWEDTLQLRNYIIKNTRTSTQLNVDAQAAGLALRNQLSVPIFDAEKVVAIVGTINKKDDYDTTDVRQLSLYFNNTWDIIGQKRSERARSQLSEQLAQSQKLEAIGTLAGGIAHDFNNVLMVIIGNAELARDNINSPEQVKQDIDEIFKGGLRARDLVNQILAFSKDSAEGVKPFDIKPIVKEAIKQLRPSIPANIKIDLDIDSGSKMVLSEPGQINQLLINLCTNAYQAMEGMDGVLGVTLSPIELSEDIRFNDKMTASHGQYLQLIVSDTGVGIPQENIKRIFEPYFTTREKEQGTGLGLAVVHGVVKTLKGAIQVVSEVGKGSKFTVYLPVEEAESHDESEILVGNLPRGNEHILYVDDDKAVALVNSKLMESLGYTVTKFSSSRAALDDFYVNTGAYDLVVTDMEMPELKGGELAKKILEHKPEMPIILCTGYSEKMDEQKAQEIGIREYLLKPLTKLDLALTVRKVLGFN